MGRQGRQPLCLARRSAGWGGLGRSRRDSGPGRAALGACGISFPLRISRPPSIWQGFLLRSYCVRGVLIEHWGRSGAPPPPPGVSGPPPLALLPKGAAPGQT